MSEGTEDPIALPVLIRWARGTYSQAIRSHLAAVGIDDLPRNGPFVLGGIATRGGSPTEVIDGLGITKQAASQLIDTLVLRGFLERAVNPDDRRRMVITLTERGNAAALVVATAIAAVDAELASRISPTEMDGLRAGLRALGEIKQHEA